MPHEFSYPVLHHASTAVGGDQNHIWLHGPRQFRNRGASGGVPNRSRDWADPLAPKPRRHVAEILRRLIDRSDPCLVTAIARNSRWVNRANNDNRRARVLSDELDRLRQYSLGPSTTARMFDLSNIRFPRDEVAGARFVHVDDVAGGRRDLLPAPRQGLPQDPDLHRL